MALDEYDEFRKEFNEKFRKITKAEVADLTKAQREKYYEIVANENIAAVPKDESSILKHSNLLIYKLPQENLQRGVKLDVIRPTSTRQT